MQSTQILISVIYHRASHEIREFDSTISYIFSTQAIFPIDSISHEYYVPLFILFSMFSNIPTQTLSEKPLRISYLIFI